MDLKAAVAAALVLAAAASAALVPARPPLYDGLPVSQAVFDRKGRLVELKPAADGKLRVWTPLREVSPLMARAMRLQEEQAQPATPGATPLATRAASLKLGIEGRTLRERARLTVEAAKLRWLYTDEELLEACLNLSPFGGSLEGVGAASLVYYDKNPDQLNLSEALTLSVIPRHPVRRTLLGLLNPGDRRERGRARRALASKLLGR